MNKILIAYFIAFTLAFTFSSCEKILFEADPPNNPETNFDELWTTLDRKYSFFVTKNINWDSIYQVYRPRVHAETSDRELFGIMADMLYKLRDGHVNLTSPFDVSRNWEWYLNSPANFNFDLIEREYLDPEYRITGPFRNKVIDSVGYIYYGNFSSHVSSKQMDFLIEEFRNLKGIIIDVRNNGGGNVMNIQTMASRFFTERTLVGYEQYKSGPGHNDFTEAFPRYIIPDTGYKYTGKVVVLTNRKCFSATNDFVLVMKNSPNVIVMGDTTGGGGGLPISSELPNGWVYRFSVSRTLSPSFFDIELGIPPDIVVYMKKEDEDRGKDTMLEAAIEEILR